MIEYLSEDISKFDIKDNLQKYHLGYLFVQIGELAKELSDYIKPEHSDDATKNPIRFLFGKLGHYRQEIKNKPHIVYANNNEQISQMAFMLGKSKDDLLDLLEELKKILDTSDTFIKFEDLVSEFEKINALKIKEVTKYLTTATLDIDQKIKVVQGQEADDISAITILEEELKELKKELESLESRTEVIGIDAFRFIKTSALESNEAKQVLSLAANWCDNEIVTKLGLTEDQINLIRLVRTLDNPPKKDNIDGEEFDTAKSLFYRSQILLQEVKKLFGADFSITSDLIIDKSESNVTKSPKKKLSKDISEFIKEFSVFSSKFSFTAFVESNLDGEIKELVKSIFILKARAISPLISKYEKKLKTVIESYNKQKTKEDTLEINEQLFDLLNESSETDSKRENQIKIARLESKIESAKKKHEAEVKLKEELITARDILITAGIKQIASAPPEENKIIPEAIADNSSNSKIDKLLNKISKLLSFLTELDKSPEIKYSDFARKMGIGFIGQYLKELHEIEEVREYLDSDSLFGFSRNTVIVTRHKTMHTPLGGVCDVKSAVKTLLPWQKSFEALKIILLEKTHTNSLSLEMYDLDRIPAWQEEHAEIETHVRISCHLMRAYNRLLQTEKANELFYDRRIQEYLQDDKASPLLKFMILDCHRSTLVKEAKSSEIIAIVQMQLNLLYIVDSWSIDNPHLDLEFARDKVEECYATYLSYNKDLADPAIVSSIINPKHLVMLADNFLENNRTQDAMKILSSIDDSIKAGKTDITTEYRWHCLMSMYHRVKQHPEKAIKSLEAAEAFLKLHHNKFIELEGDSLSYHYTTLKTLKATCCSSSALILFNKNEISLAKMRINHSIKYAEEVFKESNVIDARSIIHLADLHCHIAISWIYKSKIDKKEYNEEINYHLKEAFTKLSEVLDSNTSMKVCETWIVLAGAVSKVGDQKGSLFCLSQAEQNYYWKQCAQVIGLPLTQKVVKITDKYGHHETMELTYSEAFSVTSDESISIIGES